MAFPELINPLSPAGTDSPSLGDDQLRALKLYIVDVYGAPNNTAVSAAAFALSAAGLVTISQSPFTVPTLLQGGASQVLQISSQYSALDFLVGPTRVLSVVPSGLFFHPNLAGASGQILQSMGSNAVVNWGSPTMLGLSIVPTGSVIPHAGLTAPVGWLFCDGSAVSRTTYATLLGVIAIQTTGTTVNGSPTITLIPSTTNMVAGMPISGAGIPASTTILTVDSATQITLSANATASAAGVAIVVAPHGVGDGSTTFNLPDLRGRAAAGRDDMGGSAASRLTSALSAVPGTRLGGSGGAEVHTLTIAQMPSHSHIFNVLANAPANGNGLPVPMNGGAGNPSTDTTAPNGGGGAHQNTQPTIILNYIIRV